MYERKTEPLLSRRQFVERLLGHAAVAATIIAGALFLGIAGYHFSEGISWIDALLEASMILSGMGPVHEPQTTIGKLFASGYALFSGVVFLGLAAVILAPVLHRVLHHFHLDEGQDAGG
ncbi:MAG TPA: hypothetical protein VGS57_03935 [Thermoanaerobaculia bacterium]|jgi:uncharacterized membrane protein|nr:hypothetical protein [Thermoanaerobaculia bacterium]